MLVTNNNETLRLKPMHTSIERRGEGARLWAALWLLLALCIVTLITPERANALSPLIMVKPNQQLPLRGSLDVMPAEQAVDIKRLVAGEYDNQFVSYTNGIDVTNEGERWYRVRLANATAFDYVVLSMNDVLLSLVEVYYRESIDSWNYTVKAEFSGMHIPYKENIWPFHDIGFRIGVPKDVVKTVYFKVTNPFPTIFDPHVSDEASYVKRQLMAYVAGYCEITILLICLFISLYFCRWQVQLPYVRYALFFSAATLATCLLSYGFIFRFSAGFDWLNERLFSIIFGFVGFSCLGFARHYLETYTDFPRLDRVMGVNQWLCLVLMVSSFFLPVAEVAIVTVFAVFPLILVMTISSVYVWAIRDVKIDPYIIFNIVFLAVCLIVAAESLELIYLGSMSRMLYLGVSVIQAVVITYVTIKKCLAKSGVKLPFENDMLQVELKEAKKSNEQFVNKYSKQFVQQIWQINDDMRRLKAIITEPEALKIAEKNERETLQIAQAMEDIIDYYYVLTGNIGFESDQLHVADFLSATESFFREKAKLKNIAFKIYSDCSPDLQVICDKRRLKQIINYLIGSAIKKTDEGYVSVRVFISCTESDRLYLCAEVEDTGNSINQTRITSIFQREDHYDSDALKERGLILCKYLAELMGGYLQIENSVNQGSLFKLAIRVKMLESAGEQA